MLSNIVADITYQSFFFTGESSTWQLPNGVKISELNCWQVYLIMFKQNVLQSWSCEINVCSSC